MIKKILIQFFLIIFLANSVSATSKAEIREAQRLLNTLGFNPGPVDGVLGNKTRKALEKLYSNKSYFYEGVFGQEQMRFLETEVRRSFHQSCPNGKTLTRMLSANSDYYEHKCLPIYLSNDFNRKTFITKNISDDTTVLRDISFFDTNSDGIKEIFMCYTGYTNFPDIPMTVLSFNYNTSNKLPIAKDVSDQIFSGDIPTSNDCPHIIFEDIDGDQDKDLILADAGSDLPPWPGTAIEVAINKNGLFERVTQKFEDKIYGIRSYATGAYYDHVEKKGFVILGRDKILTLQNNKWKILNNSYSWKNKWKQKDLRFASGILMKDLDNNGFRDMYVAGAFQTKNHTVFWGGYDKGEYASLPPSKFELNQKVDKNAYGIGGDVVSTAIDDFDNDGDLDILYAIEKVGLEKNFQISYNTSTFDILENTGNRKFVNHQNPTSIKKSYYYYLSPYIEDFNQDGLLDVLFPYWTKDANFSFGYSYGSMLLVNKGSLKFEAIDMKNVLKNSYLKNGIVAPLKKTDNGWNVAIINFLAGWTKSVDQRIIIDTGKLIFTN